MKRSLEWLAPGLGLKRWILLAFAGGVLLVYSVLFGIGVFALMPALDKPHPGQNVSTDWASIHGALVLLSCGAFGLASVAGSMFLSQEHDLKRRKPRAVFAFLPPIQRLERDLPPAVRIRDALRLPAGDAEIHQLPGSECTFGKNRSFHEAGRSTKQIIAEYPRLTCPANLGCIPAISVPCGFGRAGLPIGLQIAGPPWREDLVLRPAYAYEQATAWHKRQPKIAS